MGKKNCWEVKNCGRQPGGAKAQELGICVAASDTRLNGIHGGQNAGRACWALAGTLCGGKVQGSFAEKLGNCLQCQFYDAVKQEEGSKFKGASKILEQLNQK